MKTSGLFLTLAAASVLTACLKEEDGILAERQELRLRSGIEAVTRGEVQSTAIVAGETVYAWVTDALTGEALYNACTLTAQAGGALAGTTPMYFPATGNGVRVAALHGLLTESPAVAAMPGSFAFTVSPDQSEAGGANYVHSDLLYAAQTVQRTKEAVELECYHLLSKMELKITRSDGVTDAITAVTLDGVVLGGMFTPAADADLAQRSVRAAMIVADGQRGTMTLGAMPAGDNPDNPITNDAIVVPQDVGGKTLTFTLSGGSELSYTIPAGRSFESGKKHVYEVTLKRTGLEVTSESGDWNDGGSEEVQSREVLASYTADDLKPGDYFYSDGTTSDGGLRKLYADGTLEMAVGKPVPETDGGKTVVGIVFQTDPDRIGQAEKDALAVRGATARGLVMAVKNAATNMEWGPYGTDEGLTKCETKAQNYSDISGYGNCERIRASHGDLSNYPAFRAADDYNTVCAVAGVTTGWYLPASGQWWDLLQNLGGCAMLADPAQQTSSDSGDFYWSGQGDIPAALNRWMESIAADSKDPFADYNWFWSSSEYSGIHARYWNVYSGGNVYCNWDRKDIYYDVRPVLAF